MSFISLIKASSDPDDPIYVLWDSEYGYIRHCVIEIGGGEDFSPIEAYGLINYKTVKSSRVQSLSSNPNEIFIDKDRAIIVRLENLRSWVLSLDDERKMTEKSYQFCQPETYNLFDVSYESVYKDNIPLGNSANHINDVHDFYEGYRRAWRDADNEVFTQLSMVFQPHSENDWLGWASLIFRFDSLWSEFYEENVNYKALSNLSEKYAKFFDAVSGLSWVEVHKILQALNSSGYKDPFSGFGVDKVSSSISLIRSEWDWVTVENILPSVANGVPFADIRKALNFGIDTNIINFMTDSEREI